MRGLFTNSVFAILMIALFGLQSNDANAAKNSASSANIFCVSLDNAQTEEAGDIFTNKNIRIINLGAAVNSKAFDYAPTISADGKTLYFVSDREGSITAFGDDDYFTHDFWAVTKKHRNDTVFSKPYNIDPNSEYGNQSVNTRYHEGVASIAADGQTLFFTASQRSDGIGELDLYMARIEGDKWTRPVNLGKNVNTKYSETTPSIAPDQSRLYFASDRPIPGEEDKADSYNLWYCDYDFDMEEWLPAKYMTELNTDGEDEAPFIAADNQSLFFVSNGRDDSKGGRDFYLTKWDPVAKKWSTPRNLGEPINSEGEERSITMPASGDIIYFTSDREDIPGYQGELDNFMAFVPTFFRNVTLTGTVADECSDEFIPAYISVKNPITGKIFKDSLNESHAEFAMIVTNDAFGDPRDSITYIDFEITANHPKYGSKSIVQRVEKPSKTQDQTKAGEVVETYPTKVTLGQRPVVASVIDEAAYIAQIKATQPEFAEWRGLVMSEVLSWDLYPLLNYVFFDEGSAELPSRYKTLSKSQISMFSDTTIPGATLDKYYHILNIYGFRLNMHPEAKITVLGTNDNKSPKEKGNTELSKQRATLVYNYLRDVWGISEDRMKLEFTNLSPNASKTRVREDSGLADEENRRVELLTDEWEVKKPVFETDPKTFPQPEMMTFKLENGIEDGIVAERRLEVTRDGKVWNTFTDLGTTEGEYTWNWQNADLEYPEDEVPFTAQLIVTTKSGAECKSDPINIPVKQVSSRDRIINSGADSTDEKYSLILFPFNRFDAGPLNEKILKDYVYNRVTSESKVTVIGHTDVVGLEKHNKRLSEKRANTVTTGIKKNAKKVSDITTTGVGEEKPLYPNELPEGRLYNRTIQVLIKTPLK